MHLQVLSSGSAGNATLVRAGEAHLMVDAGLGVRSLDERLALAGVAATRIDHIAITHGHLDHARGAGRLSRRADATVHCCEALMGNASMKKAKRFSTLPVGRPIEIHGADGKAALQLTAVGIPHDADPTVAFRLEHRVGGEARTAVVLTDMGRPDAEAARRLTGAHLLVLEFNHDEEMLRNGPYPAALKRRVGGDGGHLSNAQAAKMLSLLATPNLHTLVLAHLSLKNNTPQLAESAARATLDRMGLEDVRILVASQTEVGPNLRI